MDKRPEVSVVVPIHNMQGGAHFLWQLVNSLTDQTFKEWELIVTKDGKMAENTNSGIKRARGKFIKILYLDDYFSHSQALETMVGAIGDKDWLVCGTDDNQNPYWTDDIETGNNRLGSPSALMIRNESPLLFDERLSWLLDCAYYKEMERTCGKPAILPGNHITISRHSGQMTNILTDSEKLAEHEYVLKNYV